MNDNDDPPSHSIIQSSQQVWSAAELPNVYVSSLRWTVGTNMATKQDTKPVAWLNHANLMFSINSLTSCGMTLKHSANKAESLFPRILSVFGYFVVQTIGINYYMQHRGSEIPSVAVQR